jgi:hypothetical protein
MEGVGKDWRAQILLAWTRGNKRCWQGLEDTDSVGKAWRTQIVLAGTGGHERCW